MDDLVRNHSRSRWALTLALLVMAMGTALAEQQPPTVTIKGRVVDAAGNGVAGIHLSPNWSASGGQGLSPGSNAPKTASDGTFSHAFAIYGFPVVLTAFDAERNLGGTVLLEKDPGGTAVVIKAQPLAKLRFNAAFDAPGSYSVAINVMHPESRAPIAFISPDGPSIEVFVPAGTYQLFVYSMETNSVNKTVEFKPGGAATVDVELRISGLARSYGKEALPLTYSEVRGVSPDFKLADLKGKWVLLEFWGFW